MEEEDLEEAVLCKQQQKSKLKYYLWTLFLAKKTDPVLASEGLTFTTELVGHAHHNLEVFHQMAEMIDMSAFHTTK